MFRPNKISFYNQKLKNGQKIDQILYNGQMCFFMASAFQKWPIWQPCLPLLAVTVSQHFLPKMSAFNSHMRQNAFDRNWTFGDLLPCHCYAIKSNDRTICSQALQPTSAGEVANTSKLQAHHFMTPEQQTYLLCGAS